MFKNTFHMRIFNLDYASPNQDLIYNGDRLSLFPLECCYVTGYVNQHGILVIYIFNAKTIGVGPPMHLLINTMFLSSMIQ